MSDYQATDRQGRIVTIKQLADNRLVFVSQDGYLERREVVKLGLDK
jgi:hypothetical protein